MQIEVLGERYQLQEPIGRGGMATIYRGHDTRMDRVVAIKVLREVYSTDPKFVTRFQREAKAASALQHPNIVQVYDYGQTDGSYFIVMELIEGTDLRRYLRSRGILAIDRAIIIAHDVALGLGAAHRRGIVHRDVKPQNILVGRDGSIKLTDFGIASVYKDINAERLTTTGMTLGTVQYYAPEQAQGEIVNPAADVYALGIVMYEMLTGRTPFDGDTPVAVAMQHIQDMPVPPTQLNPGIPPALEEIIMRCLEKVPEMRYRDGSSLARALEVLGDEEIAETVTGSASVGLPPGGGNYAYNQVAQRSSQKNAATVTNGAGAIARTTEDMLENSPTLQQTFTNVSSGGQNSVSRPEASVGMYATPPEAGITRPFRNGAVSTQQDSRFASIITIMILLATLLLLGFSVYLASELGMLHLPNTNITPTPTSPTSTNEIAVPNLIGMEYTKAQQQAAKAHFTLNIVNNLTSGTVMKQSPGPGMSARAGSVISVTLSSPGITPTVTVPIDLIGKDRVTVEQELKALGILYHENNDGNDPTQGPDIVISTSPGGGSSLPKNTVVELYIANYHGVPSTPPTATPISRPTATPVSKPPTATPIPPPTATPIPPPTATPIPPPTATPIPTTPTTP
jgi:tRNA A-37 threonylcarbamoyl transferase component Bud32